MDENTDLAGLLNAELRPLPEWIRERLDADDPTGALVLARQFADEWLGLEARLLALGVGYVRFVAERLSRDALHAATTWVAPRMADALVTLADLPEAIRGPGSTVRCHRLPDPRSAAP